MEAQEVDNSLFPLPSLRATANGRAEHGKELRPSCPGALLPASQILTKIQLLEKQAAQPCERVGILVELAEYRLEAGRIEQAIELLERAIRCHSQAAQPVLLLGRAWEAEGNYDKALETYLEALQRGVASAEVEAVLFRQEFLLNTYPRSIAELAVVAARKKSGLLWRLLARVCEINADYDQALTFLTEALREDPKDIAALSMLARMAEKRRKVDADGQTVDFLLTPQSDRAAAEAFLQKAIHQQGLPEMITIDQSGSNTAAINRYNRTYKTAIVIRQSKYLHNLVEHGHRAVKRVVRSMLGFKSFWRARCTIAGIEVIHAIRKGQLTTTRNERQTPAEQFYSLAA